MISEKQLAEYKKIYKERFGKDITDQEALKQATKLLRLVEITYKPITVDEYKKLQKRREEIK